MHFTREHHETQFVSDKILPGMYFLISLAFLLLPPLILVVLDRVKPGSKFRWIIIFSGVMASCISVLLWQLNFPARIPLPVWQPISLFQFQPTLLVDSVSWPYSLSLVALAGAIILTSGMREEKSSSSWIFTLLNTALGVLAVSAGDPLTLALVWTAMDMMVLIVGLFLPQGQEHGRSIISAFIFRFLGTGILLVSCLVGPGVILPLSFEGLPGTLLLMLMVAGLRLGIVPIRLQNPDEATTRRGLYTNFRLVSAAASLAFLARIPGQAQPSPWNLVAFILLVVLSTWVGWKWFSSSSDIHGRPFWIMGVASLLAVSSLISDPQVGMAWGVMLVLSGGLLFLFSTHDRKILWLPLISLLGLAALPFTPAAGVWVPTSGSSWIPILFILPAQSLLLSGFIRQVLQPGERLDKSRERWTRLLYISGLLLLLGVMIILGTWGWYGAARLGTWWASIIVIILSAFFFYLGSRKKVKSRQEIAPLEKDCLQVPSETGEIHPFSRGEGFTHPFLNPGRRRWDFMVYLDIGFHSFPPCLGRSLMVIHWIIFSLTVVSATLDLKSGLALEFGLLCHPICVPFLVCAGLLGCLNGNRKTGYRVDDLRCLGVGSS